MEPAAAKKWESDAPFPVATGWTYGRDAREFIDGCLHRSLGLHNIDDLFELKASRFYKAINDIWSNSFNLCGYVYENLPNNNQYQQLQGKYEELEKRCEKQDATIEKLMEQNEKLQNQLLEKVNEVSFAR